MENPSQTQPRVASVLVIAVDPNIESLIGQLVALAGHRPLYDPALGAAGEALRRGRPDVVLLDTSLLPPVLSACLEAAEETGTRAILTSSIDNERELANEAELQHRPYFALPGGPKKMAQIIGRELSEKVRDEMRALRVASETSGAAKPSVGKLSQDGDGARHVR